jgi:hypothetical protein
VLGTVWGKINGDDEAFHELPSFNEKDEWLGMLPFGVHMFSRYVYCDLSYSKYHSAQGKNDFSMYSIKHSSYQDIFQRRCDINNVCVLFFVYQFFIISISSLKLKECMKFDFSFM